VYIFCCLSSFFFRHYKMLLPVVSVCYRRAVKKMTCLCWCVRILPGATRHHPSLKDAVKPLPKSLPLSPTCAVFFIIMWVVTICIDCGFIVSLFFDCVQNLPRLNSVATLTVSAFAIEYWLQTQLLQVSVYKCLSTCMPVHTIFYLTLKCFC